MQYSDSYFYYCSSNYYMEYITSITYEPSYAFHKIAVFQKAVLELHCYFVDITM